MSKKIIIGIDPGANGGIAIIGQDGKSVMLKKMPETPRDLLEFLQRYRRVTDCMCVMEKVQGRPKMGGSAMFNFGKGFGHLEMALLALKVRTETITPQKWQKEFQLGTKGSLTTTAWKNKLKAKAQQLFPNNEIFLWGSDAALIAEYGRRMFLK